jgi:hypothetical protein
MTADGKNAAGSKHREGGRSLPKTNHVSNSLMTKLPIASIANRDQAYNEKEILSSRPEIKLNFDQIEADKKAADERLLKF